MNERNNNFSVQIDGGKLKFIELHHYFLSSYCSNLTTSRNEEKHDNKRHLLFSVALSSYDRKTKLEPIIQFSSLTNMSFTPYFTFFIFLIPIQLFRICLYFWRSVLWSYNGKKTFFGLWCFYARTFNRWIRSQDFFTRKYVFRLHEYCMQ